MGTRQNVPQLLQRIADLERCVSMLAYCVKHGKDERVHLTDLPRGTRIEVELLDKIVTVETKS